MQYVVMFVQGLGLTEFILSYVAARLVLKVFFAIFG